MLTSKVQHGSTQPFVFCRGGSAVCARCQPGPRRVEQRWRAEEAGNLAQTPFFAGLHRVLSIGDDDVAAELGPSAAAPAKPRPSLALSAGSVATSSTEVRRRHSSNSPPP